MYHCRPQWESINPTNVSNRLWASVIDCETWTEKGPSSELKHALESFPSGHTASAFVAATYLALYLNAKLKAFSDYHTSLWKIVLVLLPLAGAGFVALSLTVDHVSASSSVECGVCLQIGFRSAQKGCRDLPLIVEFCRITTRMTYCYQFRLAYSQPCWAIVLITRLYSTTGRITFTCLGQARIEVSCQSLKGLSATCRPTTRIQDLGIMIILLPWLGQERAGAIAPRPRYQALRVRDLPKPSVEIRQRMMVRLMKCRKIDMLRN